MNLRIAFTVIAYGVTVDFMYSMNETFVFFVPMGSSTTLEVEGSSDIKAAGGEDKRGATCAYTIKPTGYSLPMQIIYGGKTDLATPGGKPTSAKALKTWVPLPARQRVDAAGHDVTATESHWMTEDSYKRYIEKIIIPEYEATCKRLNKKVGQLVGTVPVRLLRYSTVFVHLVGMHAYGVHAHTACMHMSCCHTTTVLTVGSLPFCLFDR